jgi:hypothetical protein
MDCFLQLGRFRHLDCQYAVLKSRGHVAVLGLERKAAGARFCQLAKSVRDPLKESSNTRPNSVRRPRTDRKLRAPHFQRTKALKSTMVGISCASIAGQSRKPGSWQRSAYRAHGRRYHPVIEAVALGVVHCIHQGLEDHPSMRGVASIWQPAPADGIDLQHPPRRGLIDAAEGPSRKPARAPRHHRNTTVNACCVVYKCKVSHWFSLRRPAGRASRTHIPTI